MFHHFPTVISHFHTYPKKHIMSNLVSCNCPISSDQVPSSFIQYLPYYLMRHQSVINHWGLKNPITCYIMYKGVWKWILMCGFVREWGGKHCAFYHRISEFCTNQFLHKQSFTPSTFSRSPLLHKPTFTNTNSLFYKPPFTPTSSYTNEFLHAPVSTQTNFSTNRLLHKARFAPTNFYKPAFTQISFYTNPLLHKLAFPQTTFYTNPLLHKRTFARTSFYANQLFDQPAFTQSTFCTNQLVQTSFYTNQFLHNPTFRQSSFETTFYTNQLYTTPALGQKAKGQSRPEGRRLLNNFPEYVPQFPTIVSVPIGHSHPTGFCGVVFFRWLKDMFSRISLLDHSKYIEIIEMSYFRTWHISEIVPSGKLT